MYCTATVSVCALTNRFISHIFLLVYVIFLFYFIVPTDIPINIHLGHLEMKK